MPLETGTTIADLVSTNPAATDGLGQTDDHIRLIKAVLKATFPNFTGVLDATDAALDTAATAIAGMPWDTADISNDAITYAKLQNVSATDKLLGRSSSGAGNVEEIACTAAGRALLDDADAAAQRMTLGLATVANTGAYSDLSGKPTLGTAAALDVGTTASKVVQLDGSAKLPAVDGSALTNITNANILNRDFVRISTQTLSGAAGDIRVTSGIDGTYRKYIWVLENVVPVTNGVRLVCEVSDDAGSTWKQTSYLAGMHFTTSGPSSTENALTTAVPLTQANCSNDTSYGLNGDVELYTPAGTGARKLVHFRGNYRDNTFNFVGCRGGGYWNGGNGAITGIRLIASSGNIAQGTATLYGLR